MATHVYANDDEIACRSTDGVATSAFPDPCWSPPPPDAGPILIPYANVAYARDITNGTSTVFIAGQTVAVEDKAYFATSTGNEPATYAFQKGDKTHVIKGKAYFRSWSPDVMFEGLGVDRHTDLVSHNHGSHPANTAQFHYISRSWLSKDYCKKDRKRIEKHCAPEKDDNDVKKGIKSKSKLGGLLKNKKKKSGSGSSGAWHWTDDHCAGLEVKLRSLEQAKEYADEMADIFENLPEELDLMNALEATLKDMAINAASKAALKLAVKAGLKQAAGSSVPLIGNAIMALWTAVDAGIAIYDVAQIREVAYDALEQLDVLRSKVDELKGLADEFKGFKDLPLDEQLKKAQKVGAAGQDILATINACTRVRKCQLVPYNKDGKGNLAIPLDGNEEDLAGIKTGASAADRKVESSFGGGCCPGQTGHHLIYGAMAKSCPGYKHADAPTVCVEGVNQNVGSHGRVHDKMDKEVRDLANKAGGLNADGTMDMDKAIEAAATSHMEAFPASGCSKACIKAQLEEYYKEKLNCKKVKAVNKNGKPPSTDGGGGSI